VTKEVEDELIDLWQENKCCLLSHVVVTEIVRKGKQLAPWLIHLELVLSSIGLN